MFGETITFPLLMFFFFFPIRGKEEEEQEPLEEGEREEGKSGLKLNIKKTKIMGSISSLPGKWMGIKWKQ